MTIGKMYGPALSSLFAGSVNFTADTIKCSLHTSSYAPNQDTHQFYSSVTNEVTGTAYTAGGVALSAKTSLYDAATNTLTLGCANPSWIGATIAGVRYAVFRKDTGSAGTSPLICYVDFVTDQSVTTANLSIVIPGTGLVQATVA
jgi:hypothetical protein